MLRMHAKRPRGADSAHQREADAGLAAVVSDVFLQHTSPCAHLHHDCMVLLLHRRQQGKACIAGMHERAWSS